MQPRQFLQTCAGLAAVAAVPEALQNAARAADMPTAQSERRPIWRFFGYDEPNFTFMKDGKKLLAELGQLGGPQVYVRTHHLLTSGNAESGLKWGSTNAYTEHTRGRPVYDWTITDRIFDTYLGRGLKPYGQIGFMPDALSTRPEDYPHDPPPDTLVFPGAGFSYPPKDYAKWGDLCFQWAHHSAQKYGHTADRLAAGMDLGVEAWRAGRKSPPVC